MLPEIEINCINDWLLKQIKNPLNMTIDSELSQGLSQCVIVYAPDLSSGTIQG